MAATSTGTGGRSLLPRSPVSSPAAVFALTYLVWASIHAARKSYSVIKPTLLKEQWLTTPLLDRVASKGALSTSERLSMPDTAFFLAFALSTLWKGKISDRGNPRLIMAGAVAACSFLLALFALGYFARLHPVWWYGVLWALQAFAQALVWPGAVRVMGDWFAGEGRSAFMGLWCSCNNTGNLFGAAIGAASAAALGPEVWGAPLLVLAAVLLLVSWLVFLRLTPRPELVGRRAFCWSVGAKGELVTGGSSEEEEDEEEHIIAFGPASPMVRIGADGEWEEEEEEEDERRRPLLEPAGDTEEGEGEGEGEDGRARPTAPMSMWRALWLPGALEVSLSYAALKGTSYALFFWLPTFLNVSFGLSVRDANLTAMLFDCGQLVGSPTAGLVASKSRRPHLVNCLAILLSALPIALLFVLQRRQGEGEGQGAQAGVGTLLFFAGAFSGGPQNLLATAVCQEIGSGAAAVATVASVVDGLGSLGAALMQLLVGHLATCEPTPGGDEAKTEACNLDAIFLLLVAGSLLAALALVRMAAREHRGKRRGRGVRLTERLID